MSLMGGLYIGSSGLQTGQNALNTTAHNLSNMDNVGYVRQQVQQSSRSYLKLSVDVKSVSNKQTGLGVNYSRVKHIRDYFLDKTYRRESGRSMFYQVSMQVTDEVESQLGELNGEAFQNTLEDLWTAVQEVAKDPASSVTQGLLVQRAAEFVQRAGAVYEGFCAYQDNLNLQVKKQVDKINEYGKQILALNESIRSIEAGGIESANDLRDARDNILDELAQMANINYDEDPQGNVWVQIEGMDFVKGPMCYEMGLDVDERTGFYTPYWPQNSSFDENGNFKLDSKGNPLRDDVFDLSLMISTDLNTDIGGLKAILHARGDHRANYTDLAEGKYDDVSQSIIMNIQAEFDQLIHNVATKVNEILAGAAGVKTAEKDILAADGSILVKAGDKYCESNVGGYMRKDDGSPLQMFAKVSTEGYRKVTGTVNVLDDQGNPTGQREEIEYWIYNEEDAGDPSSLYSIENLQVDPELKQKPSMLGFRLPDGSEDKATANALKDAFMAEEYTLNPNVSTPTNFVNYYKDLVSQVANSGYAFESIYFNQENSMESIQSAREQVSGVSSDEELSNMIKFQNAYNASSRYINVIDEMLEHLLSTLGV